MSKMSTKLGLFIVMLSVACINQAACNDPQRIVNRILNLSQSYLLKDYISIANRYLNNQSYGDEETSILRAVVDLGPFQEELESRDTYTHCTGNDIQPVIAISEKLNSFANENHDPYGKGPRTKCFNSLVLKVQSKVFNDCFAEFVAHELSSNYSQIREKVEVYRLWSLAFQEATQSHHQARFYTNEIIERFLNIVHSKIDWIDPEFLSAVVRYLKYRAEQTRLSDLILHGTYIISENKIEKLVDDFLIEPCVDIINGLDQKRKDNYSATNQMIAAFGVARRYMNILGLFSFFAGFSTYKLCTSFAQVDKHTFLVHLSQFISERKL